MQFTEKMQPLRRADYINADDEFGAMSKKVQIKMRKS